MSKLTKPQRDKLPEADFGDGERRLFPILDQEDVDAAVTLIGKSPEPEKTKRRIIAIAWRKGLKIPSAWKGGMPSTFAAFAGDEPNTSVKSPHGQELMQFLHDHTVRHGGAVCKAEHSPGVTGSVKGVPSVMHSNFASFMAEHEQSTFQKIHDLTLGSGAACSLYKRRDQADGALGGPTDWRPGQYQKATDPGLVGTYRSYRPGMYAGYSQEGDRLDETFAAEEARRDLAEARRSAERFAERQNKLGGRVFAAELS